MWCARWQPMSLQIRRPCSGTAPFIQHHLGGTKRLPSESTVLGALSGRPWLSRGQAEGTSPIGQPGAVGGRRHRLWAGPPEQRAPGLQRPDHGSSCPLRPRPPPPAPRSPGSGGISCARPALAAVACRWLCGPRARPRQAGGSTKGPSLGECGWDAGGRSGREPAWQWGRWPRCCVPGPTAVTRADARGTLFLTCSLGSREPVFWPRFARSGFAAPQVF